MVSNGPKRCNEDGLEAGHGLKDVTSQTFPAWSALSRVRPSRKQKPLLHGLPEEKATSKLQMHT